MSLGTKNRESMALTKERDRYRVALENLASYAVTCLPSNQPEWMDGLVEEINEVCSAIGEKDRFNFDGATITRN